MEIPRHANEKLTYFEKHIRKADRNGSSNQAFQLRRLTERIRSEFGQPAIYPKARCSLNPQER